MARSTRREFLAIFAAVVTGAGCVASLFVLAQAAIAAEPEKRIRIALKFHMITEDLSRRLRLAGSSRSPENDRLRRRLGDC